ncbi:NADAR family protein [Amycolatopsis roodepoortensis]|uniref:NADAR family protein n=1 Tax=Amycolatopsis roodepoortensis TaxID=700274 RepID=UPI00214B38B5|nr:NADAR family protein [Amycolatopsis roodepoortensis]UUV32096.1 NADAR family protein [Amycolatopsis roodepoortensis]
MTRIEEFRGRYAFLSNFYPLAQPIRGARGVLYWTAEAAFQGGKTDDLRQRARIAAALTPKEAKQLGRRVRLIPGWNEKRHGVMRAVLRAKFTDPGLAEMLVATGDAVLVEGNTWHDNDWGDCRCGRPACAEPGKNWLGLYLMELRAELARG